MNIPLSETSYVLILLKTQGECTNLSCNYCPITPCITEMPKSMEEARAQRLFKIKQKAKELIKEKVLVLDDLFEELL